MSSLIEGEGTNAHVRRTTTKHSGSGETEDPQDYCATNKKARGCPELLCYLKRTYQFQNVSDALKDFVTEEKLIVGGHILQSIIQRLYALLHVHLFADIRSMAASNVISSAKERDSIMLNLVREELSRKDHTCTKKDIFEHKHLNFAKSISKTITHDLTCSPDQLLAPITTYKAVYKAFRRPKLFTDSNEGEKGPQL